METKTPLLAYIAMKILSRQASSAESERAFSHMGRLKSDLRTTLDPHSMAANVLLKSNADLMGLKVLERKNAEEDTDLIEFDEYDDNDSIALGKKIWSGLLDSSPLLESVFADVPEPVQRPVEYLIIDKLY